MARGATTEANTLNTAAGNQLGQANTLESGLIPDYESMLSQGYTPAEENAITSAGMGAIGSSYGGASADAARTAAATNNASSLSALQDELAQQKGTAMGQEAANLATQNANEQQQNQKFGLEGLQSLYGGNLGEASSLYGSATKMYRPSGGGLSDLGFSYANGPNGPSFGIKG